MDKDVSHLGPMRGMTILFAIFQVGVPLAGSSLSEGLS